MHVVRRSDAPTYMLARGVAAPFPECVLLYVA